MQAVVVLSEALTRTEAVELQVVSRSPHVARELTEVRGDVQVTWVPDPIPRADYLVGRRMLQSRLSRVLERLKPDVVNAHGEAPFIRASLDLGVPHVITLHGIFAQQTRAHGTSAPLAYRFAYSRMRRWEAEYLPRIESLIAINSAIADYVRSKAPAVRVFRVNNAVDSALFEVLDQEADLTVLFVGQISRRKGIGILLEAFTRVLADHPSCRLRIVGGSHQDPPFEQELRHRFRALIEQGSVQFLGPQSRADIAKELARCSVLCLPSLYEASPLVVVEAMAAAKAVVATRVGDVNELVATTGAGIVVDPGDAQQLAAALGSLLEDRELRRSSGQCGRAEALRRASPDAVARDTLAVYREVANTK
jgi:glycosyltransferase involved in cell wall biosynthesis